MYDKDLQKKICLAHPDLYSFGQLDFPSLIIKNGLISLDSLTKSAFGCVLEIDEENIKKFGDLGMVPENWKS